MSRTTGHKREYVIFDQFLGDSQMTEVMFSFRGIVTPRDKCDALDITAANLFGQMLKRFVFVKAAQ